MDLKKKILLYVYEYFAYIFVVHHMCAGTLRPEEGIGSLGIGVWGGFESSWLLKTELKSSGRATTALN